jgi:5-methylcytosine-specific restriction endonuclease McrA
MPYREYLQTPEWQDRRRAALTRADRRCQVCNRSNRALHVHHRTYERRGAELETDLTVLCDQCHALYHGKKTA